MYFVVIFIILFNHLINGKIHKFPEPTNEVTGLRRGGASILRKQNAEWNKLKKMNEGYSNKNNLNEECDECFKKGSGDIRIKRSLDTNTDKKQYTRGRENKIKYDIISTSSDIPTSFYIRPFIDNIATMNSLTYIIEIDESPLSESIQATSTKQQITQQTKIQSFQLAIQTEQPFSSLNKIRKNYKNGGALIISEYTKLNGVKTLKYVENRHKNKIIKKYELNKPYFNRKYNNKPIKICNIYSTKVCTNKYILNFNGEQQELTKNIRVSVNYPIVPGEYIIAPLLSIRMDSPNLKLHSIGYKKWWDCSNPEFSAEECVYKIRRKYRKFFVNQPIQGTLRVGKSEIKGNWKNCGNIQYARKNIEKCSFKLKDIWPSTVTRIKVELMNPPKYENEFAAIEFEQISPKVHYITTTDSLDSSIKNICWGDRTKCKNKYKQGTTANIAGSKTNYFLNKLWSKPVTLKLQNKEDKPPLQSEMIYKLRGTFKSSTIWSKYLGFSVQPPFVSNSRVFNMRAPELAQIEIEIEFEPKQVLIGQILNVYVEIDNKEMGFLRSGLKSIYKSSSSLTSSYQNVDIVLTPIGNGNGDGDNIGLEPIKNIIQIRKRDKLSQNIRKRDTTCGKFKVLSSGTQCISFEVKGNGKNYYQYKKAQCIDVIGELKAVYIPKLYDIYTIINYEKSDKYKLIIKTGKSKLNGKVILTPNIISDNILSYQFLINPLTLSTKNCKSDCELEFEFSPKLPCSFDKTTGEFKTTAQITWTTQYTINQQNIYFPSPSQMKLKIIEPVFSTTDELQDFKEKYPEKYNRWKKCKSLSNDVNPKPKCNEIDGNISINCIPNNETDNEDAMQNDIIKNQQLINNENLNWWNNFWQYNWNWQYLIMGSATIFIFYAILIQLNCIKHKSILLEMLDTIPPPNINVK